MSNSNEYEAARKAHDEAFEAFAPIRDAYRAGEIDDEAFLAARAAYDEATAAFDRAFEKEARS